MIISTNCVQNRSDPLGVKLVQPFYSRLFLIFMARAIFLIVALINFEQLSFHSAVPIGYGSTLLVTRHTRLRSLRRH